MGDNCVQNRAFTYNSLSRLISATNPESGTINYSYDANGNLTSKTDARGVVTSYVYDALNRVTQRSYSTPNGTPGVGVLANYQATPNVEYFYDGANVAGGIPNSKGKLTKVSSTVSTTEYTAFDILGRVTAHKQTTDGTAYTTGYVYNLSGGLVEETYPSGRVVKNVLDADGDLSIVQSRKNQAAGFFNYAKNFTYNAAGAVTSMQLGNGLWESTVFNTRLQPTRIALGTTQSATDLLKLDYEYGAVAAVNNGNVTKQTITVPTLGQHNGFTAVQTYNYDSLNRLKSATENIDGNPTPSWKQTFTFDRYGNRRFETANGSTTTLDPNCPEAICNPTISTANNRLTSTGWQYDAAGNTTADPQGRTFIYDGENKQTEVRDQYNTVIGQYRYDGDGRRVKKISSTETTVFVYNAGGRLVAEYSTVLAETQQVSYLTMDHLGSPRVITNENGAVVGRKDFAAFGDEVATPQRTQGLGYQPTGLRQDYTGYEKDDESGLEFAQARYYNPTHGRFTSVDPLTASATIRNPQTFNRYTYALNSPYKFTDPLGLIPSSTGACGTWCPGGDSGSFGSGGGHQDISGNFLPKQQKPKKIYVFVFLTEEEQTLQSTVTNTKDPKDSRTEIFVGALDFSAVIASAPKGTEVIIKGPEATVEDFQNALKDEGAAVVFIGHASGVTVHPAGQPSRFIADGLLIGGLNDETQTYYQEDTKVDVKASFVAVFGCDTQNLSGLFKGAANFIAVDSGSDGLSPTPAIAQAGVAALLSIIRGDNAGKVENSANAALVKYSSAQTKKLPRGATASIPVNPLYNGDKVRKIQ